MPRVPSLARRGITPPRAPSTPRFTHVQRISSSVRPTSRRTPRHNSGTYYRCIFNSARPTYPAISPPRPKRRWTLATTLAFLFIWSLYPSEDFDQLRAVPRSRLTDSGRPTATSSTVVGLLTPENAWTNFTQKFEGFSNSMDGEWVSLTDKIADLILPEWSRLIPAYLRKLQRELSMAPGSLADEIWSDAHDEHIHPETRWTANVRVSNDLCEEEQEFVARRKKMAAVALASYLDLDTADVHPDDVPTIAICGSGGGLRALVAGAGSLMAAEQDGLLDCVTYTAGVSGSCWLQAIYHSTLTDGRQASKVSKILDHLKARLGIHIAYPPDALDAVSSAPTNRYLLEGMVEKLRGDNNSQIGLVDIYGILLSSRLLVPKGHLAVDEDNFKLSKQQRYIRYGQAPMPIYTAVRHEIPKIVDNNQDRPAAEVEKIIAKKEGWFQWFEITPYEFFCEEFGAGIPTWALGRRFYNGKDIPQSNGLHLPEIRMPLLMGIFGSAFCATLNHYYREIQPLVRSLSGFAPLDGIISGRSADLSKVHPIEPAQMPNFAHGMYGQLPSTTPDSILEQPYIQLMDAGMSNNLPIYPLLRPGRQVEVIIAFDNSADIKNDNWLAVTDGYARQRKIRGWPVGIGWPKGTDPLVAAEQLHEASEKSINEANTQVAEAAKQDAARKKASPTPGSGPDEHGLGYCTVWVGTTNEQKTDQHDEGIPPTQAVTDFTAPHVTSDKAGLAVIYMPLLPNPKVPGVDPRTTDYLSTWNFVYTAKQVDRVAALAQANYNEGSEQVRACVRAVYERKKKMREERKRAFRQEKYRKLVRKGQGIQLGEGDIFS